MWLKKAFLVIFLGCVQSKSGGKSSLTFVIDDTASMYDDIDQVKQNTNLVFDAVLYSNESQIDNFILVTFNDPTYKLLTITKSRATFKSALASIVVHSELNTDCPELAMTGIEQALEVSHPSSYIYVFTDASAKDYKKLESVQNTAVKKQSQIVFLLTGHCRSSKRSPDFAAYYTISKATGGLVFHMDKSNVGQVLKYVSDTVTSKRTPLVDKKLPPGHHEVAYPVDSTMKDITIALAGEKDKKVGIDVSKPDGTKADTVVIVDTPGIMIVKAVTPRSGTYLAKVDTESDSTLSITGKSAFDFYHGFSIIRPTFLNATSTQPIAGRNSHILIQLETPDENIKLESIDIVDLDEYLIMHFDAKILDAATKTYFAAGFIPPTQQFKITISAKNSKTGETLKRYSKPIEPQKPVEPSPRSPSVEILEGFKVTVSHKKPLRLTCKVKGYPKPSIVWEALETRLSFDPIELEQLEPPYEYVGVLDLPHVSTTQQYRCRATINGVTASKDINVVLENFFEVVETPKNVYRIEYNKEVTIPCKVNAYPTATTTWYFKGKILAGDENVVVSDDKLTIKHMKPDLKGRYSCSIHNDLQQNKTFFKIQITGFERPIIDNRRTKVSILQGSDATLTCRLLSGMPTPEIKWTYLRKKNDIRFELHNFNTSIIIRKVKRKFSGTQFICEARNAAGSHHHFITLNVEFPPRIKKGKISINAREGTTQMLYCRTFGNPRPYVMWTFNGTAVVRDRDHIIYRDNSLKITASKENGGKYTCKASNKHGTASQSIDVKFVVPVSIQIPDRTTIDTRVKKDVKLICRASGYPEPTIEWIFRSSDSTVSPKIFRPDSNGTLNLKNLQLDADGFYTCNASNIDGATNMTYQVNVNAPPKIVNEDKSNKYSAVEGDIVLRIPCKAKGRPKPDISWSFNGFNIAKGDWYDVEDDGTLIIKNVDIKSRGHHHCTATNYLGSDQKYFLVDVSRAPYENAPTSFVTVEEGQRTMVNCSLPQKIGSRLRWFKDRKLISEGPLMITSARSSEDSGNYTCRVSTFAGSKSATVQLIVTSAPKFQTEPDTMLEFEKDSYVALDCTNYAKPPAKTEWYFNGKKIDTDSDSHSFQMHFENIGKYLCIVSNKISNINRTFVVKLRGCMLHIQDDFSGNLPLIDMPRHLPIKTTGNYLYVPKGQILKLSCPKEFMKIRKPEITASCKEQTDFYVDGNVHKFSDLKCTIKMIPTVIRKGFRCGHVDTEVVEVGFMTGRRFSPVYEVCVDKKKSMPVYTKLSLRRALAGVDPKDPNWFNSVYVPFDFKSMYQCDRQKVHILRTLNKYFHQRDACCFGRRQLVSPKDVTPGLFQVATFNNLNVVPQWSTCHTENWNDMEDRVRSLAKATTDTLLVWTGQADQLSLPDSANYYVNVTVTDGRRHQPVPKYLWKIIQDTGRLASVAIVQVNIPDLKPEDARKHVLCHDVCDSIRWMNGGSWRDVTKGYIYCCRIREFEGAFGYRNKFSSGGDHLL